MDAREAEEMANSMLPNSPLPDAERKDDKPPEEEESVKHPEEGGSEKLPEETPIMTCTGRVLPFSLHLVL